MFAEYEGTNPAFLVVLVSRQFTADHASPSQEPGVPLLSGSRRPLPHLAYLEALADTEDDTSRWHTLTAGYAALQLFDLWVEHDCGSVPPSDLELRRVRKRVELVSSGDPVRRCLTQL